MNWRRILFASSLICLLSVSAFAESGVRGPAPHRGEHNEEVLSDWLGLSTAEISSLQTEDVILFDADWKHH